MHTDHAKDADIAESLATKEGNIMTKPTKELLEYTNLNLELVRDLKL